MVLLTLPAPKRPEEKISHKKAQKAQEVFIFEPFVPLCG
jgi:hypothetical protein